MSGGVAAGAMYDNSDETTRSVGADVGAHEHEGHEALMTTSDLTTTDMHAAESVASIIARVSGDGVARAGVTSHREPARAGGRTAAAIVAGAGAAVVGGVLSGAGTAAAAPVGQAEPIVLPVEARQLADMAAQHGLDVDSIVGLPPLQFGSGSAAALAAVTKPAEGTLTSGFGPRWGAMHNGIDIANGIGTPILAATGGIVIDSGAASGYGLWVRIQADDGTITTYGHNNENMVVDGQRVTAGQQIATIGNRGWSTGPHLHFGVEVGGKFIDPQLWLADHGIYV